MELPVFNMAGQEVGRIELPADVFEANVNRGLMHQALVRQLANSRQGTHKVKSRGEIRRTTAKWYRQKGTGRARHGSRRAPIFVGGGVAHGPKPRSYAKAMPRKMRRAALRSALTAKAQNEQIVLLDELSMAAPKTSDMAAVLARVAGDDSVLVLLPAEGNRNVELSLRNLAQATALRDSYLNIRDLLGHDKIVMSVASLENIVGFLGQDEFALAYDEEE